MNELGKRGPQPKPTVLKVLEGNPGKRKLNQSEPTPPKAMSVPRPPKRLLPAARAEWKRLAPMLVTLGVVTEADWPAFTELCQCYAYYLAVDERITQEGSAGAYKTQTTDSGYEMKHPLLSIRQQHLDAWRRALADFGLTPASRSHIIGIESANRREPSDPMERVLRGSHAL